MNFVADESVDQPIVARLREDGHKVFSVTEMEPGISDEAVLARKAMAIFSRRSLQRMIVTVSHSGLEDENPIDVFQAELIRHIRKRHVLPNRFSCRINGVFEGLYGDRKLRLLPPSKSRLEAFFGKQFDEFLKKVVSLPEEQHSSTQKTEQVDIQIHYHPQQKYLSFGYPSYTNADSLSTLNLDR